MENNIIFFLLSIAFLLLRGWTLQLLRNQLHQKALWSL